MNARKLAEALDVAGRPPAEAFAECYGYTAARDGVIGTLEDREAARPIEIRLTPASTVRQAGNVQGATAQRRR